MTTPATAPRSERLLYSSFEPFSQGTAAYTHVKEIADGLARIRHCEVTLAAHSDTSRTVRWLRVWASSIWRLWVNPPQWLYCRWHPLTLLVQVFARRRTRVIIEINGPVSEIATAHPWIERVQRLVARSLSSSAKRADGVVCSSSLTAEWVRATTNIGADKILALPNGVHEDWGSRADEGRQRWEHLGPSAIFVGALANWQGIDTILAATECASWPEDVRLVIAGNGELHDLVQSWACRPDSRVTYLGIVGHAEVPGLMAHGLVGLSVKNELARHGSPLKIYEYMAAGTVPVVSDLPLQVEAISGGKAGRIVPVRDPQALADEVRRVFENPDLSYEIGQVAKESALGEHTWQMRVVTLSKFFDGLP